MESNNIQTPQEFQLRDVYENYLKEHLLGPGYTKEVFLCNDDCSDEILDQSPTKAYTTGIIYPRFTDEATDSADDDDSEVEEDVAEKDIDLQNDTEDDSAEDDDDDSHTSEGKDGVIEKDDRTDAPNDHIGLITAVPENVERVEVEVSYAKYRQLNSEGWPDVKVQMGHLYDCLPQLLEKYDEHKELVEVLTELNEPKISELIIKDNEAKTIALKKRISIISKNEKNDYAVSGNCIKIKQKFLPKITEANEVLYKANSLLLKLFRNLYRREPVSLEPISLDLTKDYSNVPIESGKNDDIQIWTKVFTKNKKRFVKLLLRNNQTTSNIRTIPYGKCIFQPKLKLSPVDGVLTTYTEPISFATDKERETIDFVYRTVKNYGKGVGCAVEWDENGKYIQTSYMPHSDVKKFSSKVDDEYCSSIGVDPADINDCCNLYNISHWQANNDLILERLNKFVNAYAKWHERELQIMGAANKPEVTDGIIEKQKELLERLRDNVKYLEDKPRALKCFKLANTAMLIQMTVARDKHFEKNRDIIPEEHNKIFKSLKWFEDNGKKCAYYPFQLAFLLMNVKSTFERDDPFRKNVVDMIWFPTGGGKTEAYLALTALTIIARRTSSTDDNKTKGVSVIMRYTLRLLTSQQFERASYLICALEFLREKNGATGINLGDTPISIGLWIGNSGESNFDRNQKWGKFNNLQPAERAKANNPYPVTYCPWCGRKLVTNAQVPYGYNKAALYCINDDCQFHSGLPVHFVDEDVKRTKPTLLFATVDKLAQLYKRDAAKLFGVGGSVLPPDLIIQDELHLISGPLGSMVGFFENVVEKMCTKDGRSPKIIASTATTRNTSALIKSLYNREVRVFPAQGNTYEDNFFSHIEATSLRRHLGICPQSAPVIAEIRLISQMVLAKVVLIRTFIEKSGVDVNDFDAVKKCIIDHDTLRSELDYFWSLVLYYNSLKDLGRTRSRIVGHIREQVRYHEKYIQIPRVLSFIINNMTADSRIKEFTSREDSSRIKSLLTSAEARVKLKDNEKNAGEFRVESGTDFVLASNMISVGIDIARWNLMMMSGQPRSTSEYIQSSSRVGRSHKGLVVNQYSPMRIREYSMFENFTSYHAAYYKFVEPLSATPVTLQILNHPILNNVMECYKTYFSEGLSQEDAIDELCDELEQRFNLSAELKEIAKEKIEDVWDENDPILAMSLRDIDQERYIQIEQINYPRR